MTGEKKVVKNCFENLSGRDTFEIKNKSQGSQQRTEEWIMSCWKPSK